MKLKPKHHMRNLGHELHGVKARRIQEQARMAKLKERVGKIRTLERAVHERLGVLWRTGLLPAVGHGTGVS
eukprot:6439590-Pyramimonas_sp.AAC.1